MKAREISFSYLDKILNDIHTNVKVIGIIGHQSTGKSYLINKIFRTRFAVAAGRCTDGIWMSYAFLDNTHVIILDCEGLFSDQRTEDEEIKLISFLAAVCDITVLSQDLEFSRFQDRLFNVLSQAIDKVGKSDKLFKGILLFIKYGMADDTRGPQLPCRWENGKELADRLKILLVQLYTDDFADSDEIHADMKLGELDEEMKRAWTIFDLNGEENLESKEQRIKKILEDKLCSIGSNHAHLKLDENSLDGNFDNICEFICKQLRLVIDFSDKTKGEMNKTLLFVYELIPEVMSYHRPQITEWMFKRFQEPFPNENENIKEKKAKFMNSVEQYMLTF